LQKTPPIHTLDEEKMHLLSSENRELERLNANFIARFKELEAKL
jgi:hypothetical protein